MGRLFTPPLPLLQKAALQKRHARCIRHAFMVRRKSRNRQSIRSRPGAKQSVKTSCIPFNVGFVINSTRTQSRTQHTSYLIVWQKCSFPLCLHPPLPRPQKQLLYLVAAVLSALCALYGVWHRASSLSCAMAHFHASIPDISYYKNIPISKLWLSTIHLDFILTWQPKPGYGMGAPARDWTMDRAHRKERQTDKTRANRPKQCTIICDRFCCACMHPAQIAITIDTETYYREYVTILCHSVTMLTNTRSRARR